MCALRWLQLPLGSMRNRMKKFILYFLTGLGSLAAANTQSSGSSASQTPPASGTAPDATPGAAHSQAATQDPCASLSPTEAHFARQLNQQNRALFCSQFTQDQRATAMLKAAEPDATGNLISADQAVEAVAAASPLPANGSGAAAGTSGPGTSGSGTSGQDSVPEGCPS